MAMAMRWHVAGCAVALALLGATPAPAADLSRLIPDLFGRDGIVLAPPSSGPTHEPHFVVGSRRELTTLNDALRGQLGNFPLPSPASGFTFQIDPSLGVFTRSTESFGPIFAERAETIGRRKLSLGFTYSRVSFDQLDGRELDSGELQLTFLHEATGAMRGRPPFFFEGDSITARIFADITADFFVFSATYGILDHLDVGIAIPIIRIDMDVRGVAQINRAGTVNVDPNIHRFVETGGDTLTVHASGESTGIGDILLRAKYNFLQRAPVSLAAALDLRLPTGDADQLRGLDTVRVRPFLIASARVLGVSPHVNVGVDLGDTSEVENEVFYNVGFDWAIVKPVTFAVDLLGRYVLGNDRPLAGRAPGSRETAGDHILNAAVGFKFNPWRNVLILANVLIGLNDTGLRDDFTPLIGVEMSF